MINLLSYVCFLHFSLNHKKIKLDLLCIKNLGCLEKLNLGFQLFAKPVFKKFCDMCFCIFENVFTNYNLF